MPTKNDYYLNKTWVMPILLAVLTTIGLLLAIMGIGVWHILSWVALGIPLYIMIKYGVKYFK
ncbi:hypothetical protein [Albibacterium bauzanense]|nr:hypothetical protein [Albibacterium bauzanense]